ncbi:hypothetical protein ACMAY8_14495 [Rhodobacteraceae bacterium nBUS_22]
MTMVSDFDWKKARSESKIRTQGYQLVDDIFQPEFERILKVENLRSFSDPETVWKERTRANDRANKDLLNFVIASIVEGKWKSNKTPRSLTRDVAKVVATSGGLIAWARSRPDFEKIFSRMQRKKRKHQ